MFAQQVLAHLWFMRIMATSSHLPGSRCNAGSPCRHGIDHSLDGSSTTVDRLVDRRNQLGSRALRVIDVISSAGAQVSSTEVDYGERPTAHAFETETIIEP